MLVRLTLNIVTALALASAIAVAQTPAVTLSPTSLTFGNQMLGTTSVAQIVTVTNTGTAPLTVTKINSTNAGFGVFSNCRAAVNPGETCSFGVNFAPPMSGQIKGVVIITDNAPDSPQKLICTGTSTLPGVAISPISLNFGTVATGSTSATQTVTLTNQNAGGLTINGVSATGSFGITDNTCQGIVASGGTCTVTLTFSPTEGVVSGGTLTITDDDLSSPQLVSLIGTGTSGSISLSPQSLTFASQKVGTTSTAQTITLTNSGTMPLTVSNISASGDYVQTNTCPTSLAAGANCSISVTFSPSAQSPRGGYINVLDSDASTLQTVNLTGTGTANSRGGIQVSPRLASLTFTQTQTYQALLNGLPDTDVSWAVDDIVGGNTTVGTITTAGLYTPPATVGSHAIRAISNSNPSFYGSATTVITDFAGTFTYHNDNARTGQNLEERLLTTGNVNPRQFGKLFSLPVDGKLYAQPLYVSSVNIPNQGYFNVLYAVTENDSAYAFDADGKVITPLWQVNFTDPVNGITPVPSSEVEIGCSSITPVVGISGTPVIDTGSGTIFMVARTKQVQNGVTTYHQQLHALDISTGAEKPGSPVEIQASVPGFGAGSNNGTLAFDPFFENSRVSLLLTNGVVYAAWASLCDVSPYHGWVIGYDASTLAQVAVFNTSPNGSAAGIWQSQAGLAADVSGNIFLETSNGVLDVSSGGTSYGNSVIKLTPGTLTVADYFAPYNALALTLADFDLSSAGPVLLPDQPTSHPHLLVAAGKEGTIYVLDRDNMGGFSATNDGQIVQELFDAVGHELLEFEPYFGKPAYFNNHVFFWGVNDVLKDFLLCQGLLSPTPVISGTYTVQYPGPIPTISANGAANGIVWAIQTNPVLVGNSTVLRAYDAANVSRELYTSLQVPRRDKTGKVTRFQIPTVANGKVYVGTQSEVDVFGLLP